MKLITLNTWCGLAGDALIDFFRRNADVDIFALQEVVQNATDKTLWNEKERSELFREIQDALPDHRGYFAPSVFGEWGLASFVKKSIRVTEAGDIFVHKSKDSFVEKDATSIGRNLQFLKTSLPDGAPLTIVNFHGLWTGQGKSDTEDRITQSRRVIDYIRTLSGEVVLCGDFNLRPDTESIKMFERIGLQNLVSIHGITSTRTSLYTKPEKFADYIFTSPVVRVRDFRVLPDEVSDHAALFLEF